VIKLERLRK